MTATIVTATVLVAMMVAVLKGGKPHTDRRVEWLRRSVKGANSYWIM